MNNICKIFTYVVGSILISSMATCNNSTFFDDFNDFLIPLLATLLAINITTTSLITGELTKIKKIAPNCDISRSLTEMKKTFKAQIILIGSLILVYIVKDCSFILTYIEKDIVEIGTNAYSIAVFAYFLEIIYDLGCSLFDVINFNSSN